MERRRLYLTLAVASLYRYCIERLGYAEDAALKRHRVAKLALRLPQVLDELRAETMHLTGLFLLSTHLTEGNVAPLLSEARGKSRRQVEELIARWFPRPDVPSSLQPVSGELSWPAGAEQQLLSAAPASGARAQPVTCSGTGERVRARLEPLSPLRLRVEFTARAELHEKLEKARALLSHALPSGDLGELVERAVDALIEQESRKRVGQGKIRAAANARKARELKPGSRHVPVEIERAVWERDDSQCTFVDGEGRRCSERRFLTLEHRTPFALGGPPTLENLCLLCSAHNLQNARHVFSELHIETKIGAKTSAARARATRTVAVEPEQSSSTIAKPESCVAHRALAARSGQMPPTEKRPLEIPSKVLSSLFGLGFRRSEACAAVGQALGSEPGLDGEQLLRKCLVLLVPRAG